MFYECGVLAHIRKPAGPVSFKLLGFSLDGCPPGLMSVHFHLVLDQSRKQICDYFIFVSGIHVDVGCKYYAPEPMFAFAFRTHAHSLGM